VIPTISFLFGLAVGSFLNVCIHRLPRGESVVAPRSHCPSCQRLIAAYDNIPLVSYLLLGGKCRYCKVRISPQYFFVELATGLLFLLLYYLFDWSLLFAKQAIFGSLLIVLTVTDWRERLLPDLVNFPGMALGLLFSVVLPIGDGTGLWLARVAGLEGLPLFVPSLLDALLGALAGGGFLYLLGEAYFRLRHREGMGLGDVKMMAMVGCFVGPKLALLTILAGSLAGAVLGVLFILVFRKDTTYELPFGSFLGVAAFAASLWGWPVLTWYGSFFP
jgi:leader peptidase (prepilin peptidase)/N-methyltransferase